MKYSKRDSTCIYTFASEVRKFASHRGVVYRTILINEEKALVVLDKEGHKILELDVYPEEVIVQAYTIGAQRLEAYLLHGYQIIEHRDPNSEHSETIVYNSIDSLLDIAKKIHREFPKNHFVLDSAKQTIEVGKHLKITELGKCSQEATVTTVLGLQIRRKVLPDLWVAVPFPREGKDKWI